MLIKSCLDRPKSLKSRTMVEIVSTGSDYPMLSDPDVDVAKTNRFNLLGPGFVAVSILGLDVHVNGEGVIVATEEFGTKTGLSPSPTEIVEIALSKEDRVYHLPAVPLDDGETRLTLMKDL